MKKILGILIVVVIFSALPAIAGIAVYGSYWDTQEMGETGGVGARLRSDESAFTWELRAGYFPDLTEGLESLVNGEESLGFDLKIEAIPLDLGIAFLFGSTGAVRPYVGAGASYFLLESNVGNVSDEVGFYALGGFELGSGSLAFVLEGVYRVIEGTLSSEIVDWEDIIDVEIDDRIDLDLGGYGLNIGVVWRF